MQRVTNTIPSVYPGENFNEYEYTREQLSKYNPDSHACQRCGKRIWFSKKSSTYTRMLIWAKDGKPVYNEISIPTMLCQKCGKDEPLTGNKAGDYNHAIFTGNIIPFSSFTLSFILTVLHAYANRHVQKKTVHDVCAQWEISTSTLYNWIKRYKDHYDAWADSLHAIPQASPELPHCDVDGIHASEMPHPSATGARVLLATLKYLLSRLVDLVPSFFNRFTFSFLQGCKKTHFRELPTKCRPFY